MATKTFNGVKANIAFDTRVTEKANLISGENISTSLAKIDKWLVAFDSDIQSHTTDKDNPHAVTKAQVGLGSVDNTSDMDKPVSTATQVAIDTIDGIVFGGRNLIVQRTITRDRFLNKTGDEIAAVAVGRFYTDYIPVKPGEQTICSGYTNLGAYPAACFYTSDKTFLMGINNANVSATAQLTVPPNAAYLRFSAVIRDLPTLKLEKGNKATDWTPAPEDVYDKIDKRAYTTLFTGSTPISATPSVTLNTENWGFYSMLQVTATVQWAEATPVVFWIPSAQLSESTNEMAMYTFCLANSSSTAIFTINAQKINASTIQFSGATMSITNIVGVR